MRRSAWPASLESASSHIKGQGLHGIKSIEPPDWESRCEQRDRHCEGEAAAYAAHHVVGENGSMRPDTGQRLDLEARRFQ